MNYQYLAMSLTYVSLFMCNTLLHDLTFGGLAVLSALFLLSLTVPTQSLFSVAPLLCYTPMCTYLPNLIT